MRSATRGSAINEMMRMRPLQKHRSGSVSQIFLINRAQLPRASLEQSELLRSRSCAAGFGLCRPQVNPAALAVCTIESLTIPTRVGNIGADAVDPLQRPPALAPGG